MGCFHSSSNKIFVKDYDNNSYDYTYWRSNEECCICLDNKANVLFLPCKHLIVCDECVSFLYSSKKCPICQDNVYSYNLLSIISFIPI